MKKIVTKKTVVAKKPPVKKAQSGTMLDEVKITPKPKYKPMYGGPEVRAAAKAKRDSTVAANKAFSQRTAITKGFVDKEGNADLKSYYRKVEKDKKGPEGADRYGGQLNKVNASGERMETNEDSPETNRAHCKGSKCGQEMRKAVTSGAMKVKSGKTIKKRK